MPEKAKRATKAYILPDGTESRHASPEAAALLFKFAEGEEHKVSLSDFPEETLRAAAWHGLSQKLGDSFASAKDSDDTPEEMFLNQYDALKRGDWVKERASAGPRTTMVAEALHRAVPSKYPTVDDAQAAVSAWSKEEREGKLKVPALAAKIAEVKAERAAEAAAKAAAKAGDGDTSDL